MSRNNEPATTFSHPGHLRAEPQRPEEAVKMVTKARLSAAFAEWERRFREEPDRFQSDQDRLAASAESYGDGAATYFEELLTAVAT